MILDKDPHLNQTDRDSGGLRGWKRAARRAESDSKRKCGRASDPPGRKIGRKWPVFRRIRTKPAKVVPLRGHVPFSRYCRYPKSGHKGRFYSL